MRHQPWLGTAWDLANLYLGSIGAEPLGEGAPAIVGLSEETTSFVSLEYFSESDPFADFVVHEEVRVDHAGVAGILCEAAPGRNGWNVIAARCAPLTRSPARAGRTEVAET